MSSNCVNECTTSCKEIEEKEISRQSPKEVVAFDSEILIHQQPNKSANFSTKDSSSIENKVQSTIVDLKGANSPKEVLARLPIFKLWLVFVLTLAFTILLLVTSHLTHSLTLRVEAYHALYNLMALSGCLFTMKIWERHSSLKNTFGWARVEVLSCLCTLLFIASLCFSTALESIQTAAHAGHQDPMHHPLYIIAVAGGGLILNAIVFCLIGGYTHHQGCFLERRSTGVWVQRRVSDDAVQAGKRALLNSSRERADGEVHSHMSYQGIRGIIRDTGGLFVAILCSAIVFWDAGGSLALYIDPGFAMVSVSLLLYLSYPFGKECSQILLQTIPGNINVSSFSAKLLQEFPEVINIHHLHIWSLTPGKAIATAHVVYASPKVFRSSINALEQFFFEKDITKVTLQPEFLHYSSTSSSKVGSQECLIKCRNTLCRGKECCDGCSSDDIDNNHEDVTGNTLNYQYSIMNKSSPKSLNVSVSSDHHGTSAFRSSDIPMNSEASHLQPKVCQTLCHTNTETNIKKSEDGIIAENKVTSILKSKSCHMLATEPEDEGIRLLERKSDAGFGSAIF